jgi:hypothetical protein
MKDLDDLMPEWMVSPAYPPGPIAFERIAINHGALCIECKACGRRSALTRENAPNLIREGNKRLVKDGKSKCSRVLKLVMGLQVVVGSSPTALTRDG